MAVKAASKLTLLLTDLVDSKKVSKQNALQLFATNVEIDCKNLLTKPYKKAYDEVIRETGEGI